MTHSLANHLEEKALEIHLARCPFLDAPSLATFSEIVLGSLLGELPALPFLSPSVRIDLDAYSKLSQLARKVPVIQGLYMFEEKRKEEGLRICVWGLLTRLRSSKVFTCLKRKEKREGLRICVTWEPF